MSTKLMLLGILLVAMATFLQADSSAMGGVWGIVALVGFFVGVAGLFTRDRPTASSPDRDGKTPRIR